VTGSRSALIRPAVALFGLLAFGGPAFAGSADGDWARDDGLIRTRIAACGGAVCATNFWAKNPQGDEKVGDKLVMTLKETAADHWTGSAFDPQRDRTYSMEMSVAGNRMTTRGCILGGILCKSVGWTRITR
jgi:uncharacterized protein (DUF2147 family)